MLNSPRFLGLPVRCHAHLSSAARPAFLLLCLLLSAALAGAQTFSVLHTFTGLLDGISPNGLNMDRSGNLYGATGSGGVNNAGIVFKMSYRNSVWALTPLYDFTGGYNGDGQQPVGVMVGPDGRLYGATQYGGSSACYLGCGTVFSLAPPPTVCKSTFCPWKETQLYVFQGTDGALPTNADLVFDSFGNIYGTTSQGGTPELCTQYGCGAAYQLSKSNGSWTGQIIYHFEQGPGFDPYAGMISDSAGNLYGTTVGGGTYDYGTVYKLTQQNGAWSQSTMYDFTPSPDFGAWPQAGLTSDNHGNLFAATWNSGPEGGGVAIQLSPVGEGWNASLVYAFLGAGANPAGPTYSLTSDGAGNLYGATESDGTFNYGTIFELSYQNGTWVYTLLHDFTGGSDGAYPSSKVILDSQGNLYGSAATGGNTTANCPDGCGVVWEITP